MWDITMFKRWEHQKGACARCGIEVTNGDWIRYCKHYVILGEGVILHFCKKCYAFEKEGEK